MNWLQDIISKFSVQGLAVVGLAYFRDIGKGGVRTVTITNRDGEITPVALNEDYNGYIRAINNANYRLREAIDCTANLYDVEQDVAIVMWLDRKVNPNGVMQAIQQAVAGNDILNTTFDKQVILNEEGLPENDSIMMKVVVRMVSEYAGSSCPADICAVYYDPCFEVPNRPEPSVDECTLQVGGCCDYSVENIQLQTGVCITIPELINVEDWADTTEFFIGFLFGGGVVWGVNISEPFSTITSTEIITLLEDQYGEEQQAVLNYEINGNTICVFPNQDYIGVCFLAEAGFLNSLKVASNAITDIILCEDFLISGYYRQIEELCESSIENTCVPNDHAQNGLFLGNFTFQVNINGEWSDQTANVVNGTWESLNDCRTITEWRIIDAEDNVIATGEVTANCQPTTETKTTCEWLQEHQTAIEELQNNPSGLTCETMQECEAFVEVKDKADTAVQPGDLATVATTGSYKDLSDKPTIPTLTSQLINDSGYQTSSQVTTAIAAKFQFFADLANTSVNTNTSNNVLGAVLIHANTITGNAMIEIESAIRRAVAGANPLHRLMINTSNSFTGATQIAGISTSTTALWAKGERTFKAQTGILIGYNATNYQGIDDISNANAPTQTVVDWTVDQYILTVVNNTTGETTTHELTTVKVIKP